MQKGFGRRKFYIRLMQILMYIAVALTGALVLFLLVYVLAKGLPHLSWELLSTQPSYLDDRIGILPDILNTLYIVIAALLVVLPLGVGAAIYLTEYAGNKKVVGMIEYAAETLSGIPKITFLGTAVLSALSILPMLFHRLNRDVMDSIYREKSL